MLNCSQQIAGKLSSATCTYFPNSLWHVAIEHEALASQRDVIHMEISEEMTMPRAWKTTSNKMTDSEGLSWLG